MPIHMSEDEVRQLMGLKPKEPEKCPEREALDPKLADRNWYKTFMANLKAKGQ